MKTHPQSVTGGGLHLSFWILMMVVLSSLASCYYVDRQYQGARFSHFFSAAFTECKFRSSGPASPRELSACTKVASCVTDYLLDHDATERLAYFRVDRDFSSRLQEFVFAEPHVRQESGEALTPRGSGERIPVHLEYRIKPDGTITRWSAQEEDWISTGRNIRDESLPDRLGALIDEALNRDDIDAVELYRTFRRARELCYANTQT